MFKRIIKVSKNNSFFLFGPRSTGKTTLLSSEFPEGEYLWINLLNTQTESLLRRNPEALVELIDAAYIKNKSIPFVVIDEIQKNPALLDVVHRLIVERQQKFILTGSSARKLHRSASNLLAGRAFRFNCFPLTHIELNKDFVLNEVLMYGSLPQIFSFNHQDRQHFLRAYVDTYFREEVVAEQLVRNLIPFKNFLEVASQANGQILNLNNIAKNIEVDHSSVQNYFSILEDTMVGFFLPPFSQSVRKRQRGKAKFYYFDLGVQRALSGRLEIPLVAGQQDFGWAFEHFIIAEFYRLINYFKPDWKLFYLRTSDDAEIDLVIERPGQKLALIEIKSTDRVQNLNQQKLIGFKKLSEQISNAETFLISQDHHHRIEKHIEYLHWKEIFSRVGLIKH